MSLTDLDKAVRGSGLDIVTIPGWKTRGRPASTGGFSPRGQVVHHTGNHGTDTRAGELDYVKRVLVAGFSHLPGPLCQLALGRKTRDGGPVIYVVAAGRANHAGASRNAGFMRAGDGNTQAVGWEALNSGFEGWDDDQLEAYHRGVAAVADYYDWGRGDVVAHAESSTAGKWDPGVNGRVINMNTFRRAVAAVDLKSNPEDEMSAAAEKKINDLWSNLPSQKGVKDFDGVQARYIKQAARDSATTAAEVRGLTAAVKALASARGVDAATVEKAVKAAVSDFRLTLAPVRDEEDA